jgi:sugar phosphate isomerase/epimerase
MGRLAVCSWSLQPDSVESLIAAVRATGVGAVQLALDPVRTGQMPPDDVREALAAAGIAVVSGMMAMAGEDYTTLESIRQTGGLVPDHTWPANLTAARANAALAADLGISLVTFHAGFVPHDTESPAYATMLERIHQITAPFAGRGIGVGLETGQERALALLELLGRLDHPGVGVNFDPANMILYGTGDPVAALKLLFPRVLQVHVKDALPATAPGEWGTEVPAGEGAVDWDGFFRVVRRNLPEVPIVIEREAGDQRTADVRTAAALVRTYGAGQ